jgi:hypothetical protein
MTTQRWGQYNGNGIYNIDNCWADKRTVITTGVKVGCSRPSTTDIGLCDEHHAEIITGEPYEVPQEILDCLLPEHCGGPGILGFAFMCGVCADKTTAMLLAEAEFRG